MTRKQREIAFCLCMAAMALAVGLGFADRDVARRLVDALLACLCLAAAVLCDSPDWTRLP